MLQLGGKTTDTRKVGQAALEKKLAENSPVIAVIPDNFDRHDFRIAEQPVLIGVERQRTFIERAVEVLIDSRSTAHMFPEQIALDQIRDVRVADCDEITSRRIERI